MPAANPFNWQDEAAKLWRRIGPGSVLEIYDKHCIISAGQVRMAYIPFEFDGDEKTIAVMAEQFVNKAKR